MTSVLLVNKHRIPHYRIGVYNFLSKFLSNKGFRIIFVAEGIENPDQVGVHFAMKAMRLSLWNLIRITHEEKPSIIIFWTNPRLVLFAFMFFAKFTNHKIIHWGHRRDLQHPHAFLRNAIYDLEHLIDDAIILYADHMRPLINARFEKKVFVANNTLYLERQLERKPKSSYKRSLGISVDKAIICLGRLQKRKRIDDLIKAFRLLDLPNVGLILAGLDDEGLLVGINDPNIFCVGPVYGKKAVEYLMASDVYCLPGAIGLSIVDALACGLPVVTENVRHGPEIMYLKDGINGFIVEKGNIEHLSNRLRLLLVDDILRDQFSMEAVREIETNGNIRRMSEGFLTALTYVWPSRA